jgi:hypothetical protein
VIAMLAAVWGGGIGCVETIAVYRPISDATANELRDILDDHQIAITSMNRDVAASSDWRARDTVVSREGLKLRLETASPSQAVQSLPFDAVRKIKYVQRIGTGILGLVVGAASGFVIGVPVARSTTPASEEAPGAGPGILVAEIIVIAAITGAVVGAAVGETTEIDFDWDTSSHKRERCLDSQLRVEAHDLNGAVVTCWLDPAAGDSPVWAGK